MAYEANRQDEKENEKKRNDQNNANNVRNAAEVAAASGHPVASTVGHGVKAVDKATGGKASELGGKALTTANKISPMGNMAQNASNRLSESGVSDTVGNIAAKKNGVSSYKNNGVSKNVGGAVSKEQSINANRSDLSSQQVKKGGEQGGSPSSQQGKGVSEEEKEDKKDSLFDKKNQLEDNENQEEKKSTGKAMIQAFLALGIFPTIFLLLLPILFVFIAIFTVTSTISSIFGDFADAIGISNVIGEDTGGIEFETSDEEQQAFYDRVDEVRIKYEQEGKMVDALKITATFHILQHYNSNLEYKDITTSRIEEVANAMYDESGIYSDSVFENNLVQTIIPKYVAKKTEEERKDIVQEIFEYIENYYSIIGKEDATNCTTASGTCTYDIKGYYIYGKGNVAENISPSNVYVRLMQCDGKSALSGEELVPFEKYVLGVTYATMDNASEAAFKAQTVAVRSYMLARHSVMGGFRSLKEEADGKWILQAASCSGQDPIYCNPDKGCSSDSYGQVHSGQTQSGSFSKPALEESSPLRVYAIETEGEVLENAKDYVIYSSSSQKERETFTSLAGKGLNYKQILLQVYNQGDNNYGASKISQNACSNSYNANKCISTGEFSKWKQKDAAWSNVSMGNSGKTIGQIGCLVTSVAMQIEKSGAKTSISNFNPGTFVEFLNRNGGFDSDGNFQWNTATKVAPTFQYVGQVSILGMSQEQKLAKIKEIVESKGIYAVAEVMGNTGQHWVAIDSVNGNTINMMDPGSKSTNMWQEYNWRNTSTLAYYRVS